MGTFSRLLALSLLIITINGGFLRPRKSRFSKKHYDKNVIRSNIRSLAQKSKSKIKFKSHTTSDEDLTIASSEQWASCDELYFDQVLDHFGSGIGPDAVTTFPQRYFVCGKDLYDWKPNDPVFFYCGNEAKVTEYIKYTGLMWEQASTFNALLVFAEHRYYGESLPYTQADIIDDTDKLQYLTVDQALEDFAVLIDYLKKNTFSYSDDFNGESSHLSAIIGFGGSYGGMLAAWFRMKYPQYMDGAIAGSAPVLGVHGLVPATNAYSFADMETSDCSVDAGVVNNLCIENFQTGWDDILTMSETVSGRTQLATIFNLCTTPTEDDAVYVLYVVEEAIAYMAMSSYPYSSNYITGAVLDTDTGGLPPYPLEYGCNENLVEDFSTSLERVKAIGTFNEIFWNADGSGTCLDFDTLWTTYDDYLWDYLYCRSLLMPSGMKGGDDDMFWSDEWSADETISWCNEEYDIAVDIKGPASRKYGGRDLYKSLSNVVFSNGDMDPWMPGGVTTDDLIGGTGYSDSLVTILIEKSGHHLDLMFSNPNDQESVINAREIEVENIRKWIQQSNSKYNMGMCDAANADINDEFSPSKTKNPFITAFNMLM